MMQALQAWIAGLEADRSLLEPAQLRRRIDAIDRLEACLFGALPDAGPGEEARLRDRAEALCTRLEAANQRLYRDLRQAVLRGDGPRALREWMPASIGNGDTCTQEGDRYDHLDALLSGVLQLQEPDAETVARTAEMVFYQPTPARHIFDLIRRTALDDHDVLFDLGAGLGHVSLLAAICTRARCIGVEREPAYVATARRCAQALGLERAVFLPQDVRQADLSAGTVFYLYTPFTGTLLADVLGMLRREAGTRAIRICTLGPCTPIVAREPWLRTDDAPATDKPVLFHGDGA